MKHVTALTCMVCLVSTAASAFDKESEQEREREREEARASHSVAAVEHSDVQFQAMRFRHVGPYRGGRSTAVAGVTSQPFTFYMGSTGGGVFKTTDAGTSWVNVSDRYFKAGSIGAVAVSESEPDVVYVGTGSACPRGNVSPGIGMYKSTDAGATWTHIGLRDAGQIGKLAIHPRDPNIVFVAALGHIFGPNEERGVFRTRDGGKTWEQKLFLDERTGAVDIKLDPSNPEVVYAAFWHVERKPWTINSGGPVGGVYKSTDGGETWSKLTNGLPKGMTGRIGIAVSPANPRRIWAIIEGERIFSGFPRDETGMYRSDDAGASWQHINADPELHQRPWYYHHLVADPKDADVVYHVGDSFWKSTDAGKTYEVIDTPHVDHHDLWINPNDPRIMVQADDGGGTVTFNGGKTWSTQLNQPTAELYRATVDDEFPYRLYAGQQDYGTISLPSRAYSAGGITLQHWTSVGGGEIGPVAVDPMDSEIIYAGGFLSRMNREEGQIRRIQDYPQYWMGVPSPKLKYRVPSDSPILASRYKPNLVYSTSQYVHRSLNGGQNFEIISPDLTRNDRSRIVASGGPLTRDITSIETYSTIVTIMESPIDAQQVWTGSDDGVVHLSRDSGTTWVNVTPAGMPEGGRVNSIDPSSHAPGRAVIAVNRYMHDDFAPYIFRTDDFGKSWKQISKGNGIPSNHFVRAVREDPHRKGLLFAGTEFGLFVSFDDGDHWRPFQLNLPITPVADVLLKRDDLVVATQGRGFWILDDITPLHQQAELGDGSRPFLYRPRDVHRVEGGWRQPGRYVISDDFYGGSIETDRTGENPPAGLVIHYHVPVEAEPPAEMKLRILDSSGREAHVYSTADQTLPVKPGINSVLWDLTYPGPNLIPESRLDGYTGGPRAVPGRYEAILDAGTGSQSQYFEVLADPRSKASQADLQEQFDFLLGVRDQITAAHDGVRLIQKMRTALNARAADSRALALRKRLDAIEDHLRQKRSKVWQDTVNFETLIDDQLAWLAGYVISADTRPTDSAYTRRSDLTKDLDAQLSELDRIKGVELKNLAVALPD